jgi:dihydroneopterin aldolase
VALRTARSLERAIEEAVSLQPFVERADVSIRPERGGAVGTGRFAYRYLTASMLHARLELRVGREDVVAELSFREDLQYPLMRVVPGRLARGRASSRGSRRPPRKARRG